MEWQGAIEGDWEHPSSSHPQPPVEPSTPDSTDPKTSANLDVTSFLIEIKYCEDTRPQNQLNAAKEQHKDLCNIL